MALISKGRGMAFDDLTPQQRQLVTDLVENLATGNYGSEFWALATLGRGWFIELTGQGGASGRDVEGFAETDLRALESEGYITLIPKRYGFAASLKVKAYNEYKAGRLTDRTPETGQRGPEPEAPGMRPAGGFDEAHLQRIEEDSLALVDELHENYGLSRRQAASWFRWTLGASVAGFAILAAGVVLVLTEKVAVGLTSALGGVIAEFLGLVFYKQAKDANDRQDEYHADLITRQRLLDAVQVVRLMTDAADRNRVIEKIITQLLGVEDEGGTQEH